MKQDTEPTRVTGDMQSDTGHCANAVTAATRVTGDVEGQMGHCADPCSRCRGRWPFLVAQNWTEMKCCIRSRLKLKEIEPGIKNLPTKKHPAPDGFRGEFHWTLKEGLTALILKLFQKLKRKQQLLLLSMRPALPWYESWTDTTRKPLQTLQTSIQKSSTEH